MEEKTKMPGGFFDKDHLLVDKEIADPFRENLQPDKVYKYPFAYENSSKKGYIRYTIQEKTVIILDCVFTDNRY